MPCSWEEDGLGVVKSRLQLVPKILGVALIEVLLLERNCQVMSHEDECLGPLWSCEGCDICNGGVQALGKKMRLSVQGPRQIVCTINGEGLELDFLHVCHGGDKE